MAIGGKVESDDQHYVALPKVNTTEARVLRAAAESFSTRGYHGASLRDIADTVGIQAASLYHYVDSKQTLLVEVMVNALRRRHHAVVNEVKQKHSPASRLAAFARAHVRWQGEFQAEARVCLTEVRSLEPSTRPRILKPISNHEALLASILVDGGAAGEFVIPDLDGTMQGFLDAWDGVAFWFRPEGELTLEQIANRYAQFANRAISAVPITGSSTEEAPRANESSTRAQILSAGTELFAERGYTGTTVRALASRAGVQPSVIYHHFENKEGLLYAIMSAAMRTMLEEVRRAMSSASRPPDQLAAWVRAHVRTDGTRKLASIVSDAELHALSDRHREVVVAQRRYYEDLLTEIVQRGMREGLFDIQSPKLAVYAIARMCSATGKWQSSNDSHRLSELGDLYAELILAGLGYRQGSPSPAPTALLSEPST